MAPKKKTRDSQNGGAQYLLETLQSEIQSVVTEIRVARKKLERTIQDLRLQVVSYKSQLEPDMLSSNLYELMQRENNALFVNKIDGYLDISGVKTRHVASQDETQRSCLEEDNRDSQRTIIESEQSKTKNLTVGEQDDVQSTDTSGKRSLDLLKHEGCVKTFENNTHLIEILQGVDVQTKNEIDGKVESDFKDKKNIDVQVVDTLCENMIKRCDIQKLQTNDNKIKTDDCVRKCATGTSDKSKDLGIKTENIGTRSAATKESADYLFHACIEKNLHMLTISNSSRNETTTVDKPVKWQDKYDNYKKATKLQCSKSENPIINNKSKHQNISPSCNTKVESVHGNNILQEENKKSRSTENITEVRTEKMITNENDHTKQLDKYKNNMGNPTSSRQKDQFLKSPLLSKTNLARTTSQISNSVQNNELIRSTNERCQSKSHNDKKQISSTYKANILRASKLGPPVENLIKRLSNCGTRSEIIGSINRTSTPKKIKSPNKRVNSEQRQTNHSKIPKILNSSPLPKSNRTSVNFKYRSNTVQALEKAHRSVSCPDGKSTTLIRNKIPLVANNQNSMITKGRDPIFNKNSKQKSKILKNAQIQSQIKPPSLKHAENISRTLQPPKNINDEISKPTFNHLPNKTDYLPEILGTTNPTDKLTESTDHIGVKQNSLDTKDNEKTKEIYPPTRTNINDTKEKQNTSNFHTKSPDIIETKSLSLVQYENDASSKQSKELLEVPEDLYVLRNDIPVKRRKCEKPVNFIQKNKEKIKKMAMKKRRSSKAKTKSNLYKNSIVIDSRYLMIFNKILEDRYCMKCNLCHTGCQLSDGKSNFISKDDSRSSKQNMVSDSDIFLKFPNLNQLQTVLSGEVLKQPLTLNFQGTTDFCNSSILAHNKEQNFQNKSELLPMSQDTERTRSPIMDDSRNVPRERNALVVCNGNDENYNAVKNQEEPIVKNEVCRFEYVARTQPIRKSEIQVTTEKNTNNKLNLQNELTKTSGNILRDSVEIVEMAQDRISKCKSQGSVAGSSLLSCLKSDSIWREHGKKSSKRYSGLQCLSDRSNDNSKGHCRIDTSPERRNTKFNSSQASLIKIAELKDRGNKNNAQLDDADKRNGNATIEIDEKSLETKNTSSNRSLLKSFHENSSDIIKSHKTLEGLNISSIEKSTDEIYTLNSTKESHGQTPVQYRARHKKVDSSVQRNKRSSIQITQTKSNISNTKNYGASIISCQSHKESSIKTNSDKSQNIVQRNSKIKNNISSSSQNNSKISSNMDKSIEIINSKLNHIKQELEDLSLDTLNIRKFHNNFSAEPSYESIEEIKQSENIDNEKATQKPQQKIIKLEADESESVPIELISENDATGDDSVVYLETKIKLEARKSIDHNQKPLSLIPIENLLSTQYKKKDTRVSQKEVSFIDQIYDSENPIHDEILKNEQFSEKRVDDSLYEFDKSLDNAFTSTKHNITQTPGSRGSAAFKTPRSASIRRKPSLNLSLTTRPPITPKSSNVKPVVKTPQLSVNKNSSSSVKPRQTPTGSVKKLTAPDRTATVTPKNLLQKRKQLLVSSTPIQEGLEQGLFIKEEPS